MFLGRSFSSLDLALEPTLHQNWPFSQSTTTTLSTNEPMLFLSFWWAGSWLT